MKITALFHKHSPFQSIQMPRRGCPRLREHVEHTRMQGTQLLWYPRSNHTWRLHNSGFGCHPKRSSEIADPSWRGSARAMPPALSGPGTKAGSASSGRWVSPKHLFFFSFFLYTAWLLASAMSARPPSAGSETGRRTAGYVHSRARGEQIHLRCPVASPNHPNQLRMQPPLSLRNPLPRKHVRPVVQKTGDVRCSDWEKVTVHT